MIDRAAQRVVSFPDFSLPAAADLPGVADEHASLLQLYQRRSQCFFANPSRRFWWLLLKGYVSGSLAAPSLCSPILDTLTFSAAVLFRGSLTFFKSPFTRGPLLAHLRTLALPLGPLGPCPLCPLLLPLARIPRGRPRRLALAMAGRPMLPTTSGSLTLARSAPTVGVRPGSALTARSPHSAGRGPRGQRPGPPTSSARASPSPCQAAGPL